MIRAVIIEDEEKSAEVIGDLLRQYAPDIELIGTAGNVEKAVTIIATNEPQMVFLDVQLADGSGFDVLRKLSSRNFELIFITAFNHYAVEAFRFAAIDYLLKPLHIGDFEQAVNRARQRIKEKNGPLQIEKLLSYLSVQKESSTRISIATVTGYEFFDVSEIEWCHSEGAYAVFHLSKKTRLISSRNLGFYEDILAANGFCRIHHGTMINIRFIKSYVKGKGGYVVMQDGTELEVSQRKKADFLKRYTI